MPDNLPEKRSSPKVAACCCVLLLSAFAAISWSAVRGKCVTVDEPLHALGALAVSHGDYRVNAEDPPLWQRWAALGASRSAVHIDLNDDRLKQMESHYYARSTWLDDTLFMTPGNRPDDLIASMRAMMLAIGVGLGALIAFWSWKLGGGLAAVAATALFCFDPNFLAHAPLVKNDVSMSLAGLALAFAVWRAGLRLTWLSATAVALCTAGVLLVKFSGPLLVVALICLLLARALLISTPWRYFGKTASTRSRRLLVAGGLLLASGVVAYTAIWACYSFRFAASAAGQHWNFIPILEETLTKEIIASHPERAEVLPEEARAWRPGAFVKTVMFLNNHRALPQTWLFGLMFTRTNTVLRPTEYLMGQFSRIGFPQYFPLAYLFKTPLATQVAVILAAMGGVAVLRARRRGGAASSSTPSPHAWAAACIGIPFTVLFTADLTSHINIGIRHLLPVYPFLYVAVGCGVAWSVRNGGRRARFLVLALVVALVAETTFAFPNFIPFFNVACGGPRGGFTLLGDSNLDWGQDLPLLVQWQRAHPERPLYLCYFGTADPLFYGLRYTPLTGTMIFHDRVAIVKNPDFPKTPGVIAVSATLLQGIYLNDHQRALYRVLHENLTPIDVLGGSIYLYEYNPN